MNLVLDDAEEVNIKKKTRKTLGRLNFFALFPFNAQLSFALPKMI